MPLKVMVVDDEPEILSLIKSMVEPLGCETLIVSDSREAAQRLQWEKFDGIFVDILMPHLDGFELTKEIRSSVLNKNVPVVMLSGLEEVGTMRRGFSAGATCFLFKPISQERILSLVKAMRGPMLRERRRHARLPLRVPVKCRAGQALDKKFIAGSETIAEGGMLLGPSGGFEPGELIELEFTLPRESEPVKVPGRILRKEPQDRIAVGFTEMDEVSRSAIERYIRGAVTF